MEAWIPRDCDMLVTKENFIFYVFGCEHPEELVFSFLKYIPSDLESHFPLRFLKRRWNEWKTLKPLKLIIRSWWARGLVKISTFVDFHRDFKILAHSITVKFIFCAYEY